MSVQDLASPLVADGPKVMRHPCARCDRRLIHSNFWSAATKATRQAWRDLGCSRAGRGNLCSACYAWLRSRGQLDQYPTIAPRPRVDRTRRWVTCLRCGSATVADDTLCRDCVDVTHDLDERARWRGAR